MNLKRIARALRFRVSNPQLFDDQFHEGLLQALSPVFDDRSIALVGNAESIFEQAFGEEIDSHDIVVRFNRGVIREPSCQGSRTDVLCLACDLRLEQIQEDFKEPLLIWVTPMRHLMAAEHRRSVICYPIRRWRALYREVPASRPSAGLISLHMFRTVFQPSRITMYGFDWKATRTFYHAAASYRARKVGHHDWDAEKELVLRWLREDPRISHVSR
jgi:hypothetical protein